MWAWDILKKNKGQKSQRIIADGFDNANYILLRIKVEKEIWILKEDKHPNAGLKKIMKKLLKCLCTSLS